MNILILAEYYAPYIMGGGEISLKQCIDGLVNKGHSVYILTPNCENYETTFFRSNNLIIHRYKSIKCKTYKQKSKNVSANIYNKNKAIYYLILNQVGKIFTWEMVRQINKVMKTNKFDLIHSNNIESMMALSKIETSIPTIAHVRDLATVSLNYMTHNNKYCNLITTDIYKEYFNTNNFMAKLIIWDIQKRRIKALNKIKHIITINKYVKEQIKIFRMTNDKDDNIKVLYNPISNVISKLNKKDAKKKLGLKKKNNVLFVGSLVDIKGAQYLVDIAYSLPNINFVIIGDGPYREDIENSGLKNIIYKSKVKDIKDYYKACDMLLLPQTVHYGFGRVVIEAMMNGLPIISTNIKGIDEFVINGITGILVNDWNANEFKIAINCMLRFKILKHQMSNNCKKLVKDKFEVNNIINKLEKIYKDIK